MSAAAGARPQAQPQSEDGKLGCTIIAVGLILFGGWFGATKTIEFAHGVLYDPDVAIEAEMEYLQQKMPCEPGEVLEITPLGNHGARSVRCVPGNNMPRREPRG